MLAQLHARAKRFLIARALLLDTRFLVADEIQKWAEVAVELKAQEAPPSGGCVYYERCSLAGKDGDCARSRPALLETEPDHLVACRLSGSQ